MNSPQSGSVSCWRVAVDSLCYPQMTQIFAEAWSVMLEEIQPLLDSGTVHVGRSHVPDQSDSGNLMSI